MGSIQITARAPSSCRLSQEFTRGLEMSLSANSLVPREEKPHPLLSARGPSRVRERALSSNPPLGAGRKPRQEAGGSDGLECHSWRSAARTGRSPDRGGRNSCPSRAGVPRLHRSSRNKPSRQRNPHPQRPAAARLLRETARLCRTELESRSSQRDSF